VLPDTRASAASRSAVPSFSFLTSRSRLAPIAALPRATAAASTSTITTSIPAVAQACAMPLPMVPAPITPTVLIASIARPRGCSAKLCARGKGFPG